MDLEESILHYSIFILDLRLYCFIVQEHWTVSIYGQYNLRVHSAFTHKQVSPQALSF